MLSSADRLLLPAVVASLAALELDEKDTAAARLAESYARQIDRAGAVAAQADATLRQAEESGDEVLIEAVKALRAKAAEQVVLDRLGARLESILVQLRATPKARLTGERPAPPVDGALARLRGVG